MATQSSTTGNTTGPTDDLDKPAAVIQVVLTIPHATIHQVASPTAPKTTIGQGELRVYSSAPLHDHADIGGRDHLPHPPSTTFMTLETNETPTKSFKSLITHPLMPRSTAQKIGDSTWQFSVPGNGFLELELPHASQSDIAALENLLADRIVYTNQYHLRNQLALVDDVGQIYGVLDKEDAVMEDADNVSLAENQKSPVVVQEMEQDDDPTKPLKLKITVPSADDMADYLTSASQYFGESLVKGATVVAGGIATSSTFLNSKIPETQKPLHISPFIKNRVRNMTSVSRATFSVTSRLKSKIVSTALNSGYRAIKYWTTTDDPEAYSTMQNIAYSLLNSAGVLIQAAEESIGIVSAPAITATQDLAGRALGPDARELVSEALEGLKNFTLVYFDNAGISRRAFLQTSRIAALQTAQEVRDGKIKIRERKSHPEGEGSSSSSKGITVQVPFAGAAVGAANQVKDSANQVKELIFSYFGKTEDGAADGSATKRAPPSSSSSGAAAFDVNEKKKKTE